MKEEALVSIVMVNYNKERYLRQAIASVVSQTYHNWELIVVDDGSTDSSRDIIKSFKDNRIKPIFLKKNSHICVATNTGLKAAKGKYIARLDSDDVWKMDKLSKQLNVLESHVDAKVCFTKLEIIDENSDIRCDCQELLELYNSRQENGEAWLRFFFFFGNSLIQSSMVYERALHEVVGYFNLTYIQAHDMDFFVRLAKQTEFYFVEEALTLYRRTEEQNSSVSERNSIRFMNEHMNIRKHFFDDIDSQRFVSAFGGLFINPSSELENELECEKALLLRRAIECTEVNPVLGMDALERLYQCDENVEVLSNQYSYSLFDYYADNAKKQYYSIETIKEIERYKEEKSSLMAHKDSLQDMVTEQQKVIVSMKRSTSWRVTKPLRAIKDLSNKRNGALSRKKKVLIHAYLFSNLGDDLFVRELCDRYRNTEFLVLAPKYYRETFSNLNNCKVISTDSFGTKRKNKKGIKEGEFDAAKMELARRSDLTVHIGGSVFVQHGTEWKAFFEYDRNLILNSKKLYQISGNFGPYTDDSYLASYNELFKEYGGISFRDRYSYELFQTLGNVTCGPDVLFGMTAPINEKKKNVTISVINLEHREELCDFEREYINFIVRIIAYFNEKKYSISLVSFCSFEQDTVMLNKIWACLNEELRQSTKCHAYEKNIEEILSLFADSEYVVGTRFHSIVLGLIYGCKVIPLSYSNKTSNMLFDLGFDQYYVVSELNHELCISEIVDKAISLERKDEIKQEVERMYQFLDAELL
ncbi:glycosyltransferase [Ohessyouella blattaphilus]|uniref:Glycosyltransferase n=1 Tax=Ohessyouella blattaphilus TaxID=2949333 RepID=A0ABT1ED70_9FIRM|nr:glycosyltransferase [Ohessyouella blattaphilus]MCP1108637.1 glycosyltransferase [Ohessyouella blattaphilus]MCR8562031.1 glycosyltransferase [Ohessyouella blattaphilus]